MASPLRTTAVLTLSLISVLLSSCGFNDELTRRGFLKNGDQICADTLVKTGLGFTSATSQSDFLTALGIAYGDAATRFHRLEVRSDDDAMRDKIVTRFGSFSRRLDAAANGADGPIAVRRIFSDGAAFENELHAYGFATCGGGGGK
jgi:hypothetical protein